MNTTAEIEAIANQITAKSIVSSMTLDDLTTVLHRAEALFATTGETVYEEIKALVQNELNARGAQGYRRADYLVDTLADLLG